MTNYKIILTKEGLEKLKTEYKELIDKKRPEIAERLQTAREMGDLSENASYQTAKDEQAFIEGRVTELEQILKNSEVAKQNGDKNVVSIGSQVKVHIEGTEATFWMVGATEANPDEKKISHESPLGQALMGKRVGDSIEVDAPIGKITYKIISVS